MNLISFIICFIALVAQLNAQTLLFLGDSLTAGYGIPQKMAFPNLIDQRLTGNTLTIINAGVSGDTTFNLINRLSWVLKETNPDIAFVSIGANDGLRGFDTNLIKANVQEIINKLTSHNIKTILAGMSLPKNYSETYIQSFENVFQSLAKDNNLIFYPFLLKDVAGIDTLNLSDRIHPNAAGHQILADNITEFLVSNNIILQSNTLK